MSRRTVSTDAELDQALCEIAGNKYLSEDHQLSKEQEALITEHGFTKRRGERTLGKIIPISTQEERDSIFEELSDLYPKLYNESFPEGAATLNTKARTGLSNTTFTKTMRALSQKRTHDLRIQLYREFLNTTFLLALDESKAPLVIEQLATLSCFAVFTDDKSVRCWNPRGSELKKAYGFEIIIEIMPHNPGSLIINPQGNISGELYKKELQTLAKAAQRFLPKRYS